MKNDKSVKIGGDNYGPIITGDNSTITQLVPHIVPCQLSSTLGKSSNFIGREEELKEINKKLNRANTLLINGFGGVGKSTIASHYLHTQKEQFDYYGFFEGINGFISELERAFGLKRGLSKDSLLDIIYKLRGLENSKKLLVIDDVKEIEKNKKLIEKILALKESGCTILLTSREQIENINIYSLDVLSLDDAKVLFNSIFKMEDESLLEEILTYLDCHAFFVEMTAKSLRVNTQRTPEKMIKMFREGKFSKIKANKEESFNDFLNQQFSLDSLDDEDSLLLKQLSILPSIEIDFKFLTKIFGLTDEGEIEEFQDLLNFLVKKGWLSTNGKNYKLHQIVKEFIWENHKPTPEEIDKIVLFFVKLIENHNDVQSAIFLRGYLVYFECIDDVLNRVGVFNKQIIEFWDSLGSIYEYNGFYNEALPFFIKVMTIREKILGEEHSCTISSYRILAGLYVSLELYDKAEYLFLKALKIQKKLLREEDDTTILIYNDLGELYHVMGEYVKAELFYLKAFEIWKKMLGEEHLNIATSCNNLAGLYVSMKEYDKVESFYLKALNIWKKLLGKDQPEIAIVANGLASFYYDKKDYKRAYEYIQMAVDIWSKNFPKNHPYLLNGINWLELIKSKLKEKKDK